jgi:hypothetical protein
MTTTRTRGLGSVYQRGETWWVKFYVGGKAVRESSGSPKSSVAVRLLKRRLEELAAGRFVPDADKVTFADLWTMLTDDYKMHERALRRVNGAHAHLQAAFGSDLARSVTGDRLTRYAHTRQDEGAALATIQQELALLRRAFNLAVRAGRLVHRPAFPTLHISHRRAQPRARGRESIGGDAVDRPQDRSSVPPLCDCGGSRLAGRRRETGRPARGWAQFGHNFAGRDTVTRTHYAVTRCSRNAEGGIRTHTGVGS